MLFSPNRGHHLVDDPPLPKYSVRNADGSTTIVKGFPPASKLNYSDVCLTAQIRDGIRLPEVNGSDFLSPSLEERENTLNELNSTIVKEIQKPAE